MAASDSAFLDKRRKFVKSASIVLTFSLALVAGFGLWLYFQQPLMINFVVVAREIENGGLSQLTIELMAIMLPIAMLMCLVLLAGVIGLCWAWFANEKRYLRIITEQISRAQVRQAIVN